MSGKRKPVEDGCTGSVFCELPDHVYAVRIKNGQRIRHIQLRHIQLTLGQRRTIAERSVVRLAGGGSQ